MKKDLRDYRKSYEKQELLESTISKDPMELFQRWFQEIDENFEDEPNAMTISTIGLDGFPKSRVVLLKEFTQEGFVFYTNYESEKGKSIENNPNVCLSFFWHQVERQVIIKGVAEKTSQQMNDDYFNSRPRGSQLGALVSHQSDILENRHVLEEKLKQFEEHYEGKPIPRPGYWGGYLVRPIEIEFWQGRADRLHDRIQYQVDNNHHWKTHRLYP